MCPCSAPGATMAVRDVRGTSPSCRERTCSHSTTGQLSSWFQAMSCNCLKQTKRLAIHVWAAAHAGTTAAWCSQADVRDRSADQDVPAPSPLRPLPGADCCSPWGMSAQLPASACRELTPTWQQLLAVPAKAAHQLRTAQCATPASHSGCRDFSTRDVNRHHLQSKSNLVDLEKGRT